MLVSRCVQCAVNLDSFLLYTHTYINWNDHLVALKNLDPFRPLLDILIIVLTICILHSIKDEKNHTERKGKNTSTVFVSVDSVTRCNSCN